MAFSYLEFSSRYLFYGISGIGGHAQNTLAWFILNQLRQQCHQVFLPTNKGTLIHGLQRYHSLGFVPRSWVLVVDIGILGFAPKFLGYWDCSWDLNC